MSVGIGHYGQESNVRYPCILYLATNDSDDSDGTNIDGEDNYYCCFYCY